MEEIIMKFIVFLRKAGINAGVTEAQDCLRGLEKTGMNKSLFYQTMRTTLVKDYSSFAAFDRAFELYFRVPGHNLSKGVSMAAPDALAELLSPGGSCARQGGAVGAGQRGMRQEQMVQVVKLGNEDIYRILLETGIRELDPLTWEGFVDLDEVIRKIKVLLEWNMAKNELFKEAQDEGSELWWVLQDRFERMEQILRNLLEKEFVVNFGEKGLEKILERENLNTLDFYQLKDYQIEEIKKKITCLGHKLATRKGYRRSRSKKGTVDLRRTIRTALKAGGNPLYIKYINRIPTRPELWVLCDISGSVKRFSEFMLQLTYGVHRKFLRVRSFVFVDTLAEASQCFDKEINEALPEVYNTLKFSKTGFSDYGEVFRDLFEHHRNDLNKNISLLVIGDGRNNYRPLKGEYLREVSKLVRYVFWLNPEPEESWNTEDGIVAGYSSYCNRIFECRNLWQLEKAARAILRKSN